MEKLKLKDVRKTLPFNINYGMADLSIKDILNPNYNIEIDWDVFLPSKNINLQRGFVWTLDQKRELIYSIFKGIKIANITFIQFKDDYGKSTEKTIYKIIDGKQRLSTMISFCKGEFSIFWDNKEYYFDDLDLSIQGEFLFHGRLISDIGYEYPDKLISDDDKIAWFEMINFAGTPQDIEHLKNLKS